ncbi:MAG: hypothetical protein WA908_02190 [Pontixanthobacter sp.]
MSNNFDLTHVEPHRRDEVMRRIAAIQRFNKVKGRKAAALGAAELGLSITSFYRLAAVWKLTRDAAKLPGQWKKAPANRLAEEQKAVISKAVESKPEGRLMEVVETAIELGKASDVTMPTKKTMSEQIHRLRKGTMLELPPHATHVIDHCVIDVPIAQDAGPPNRGWLTVLIDVEAAEVVGCAMTDEAPNASVTRAAIEDAQRHKAFARVHPTILIDCEDTSQWHDLGKWLAKSGMTAIGEMLPKGALAQDAIPLRKRGNGRAVLALIGRWIAGYKITIRKNSITPQLYQLKPTSGAGMTVSEAEELIRDRIRSE